MRLLSTLLRAFGVEVVTEEDAALLKAIQATTEDHARRLQSLREQAQLISRQRNHKN